MRTIMTALLGLSLLSGTAVFAQDTPAPDTTAKKKTKKSKKPKKDTTSEPAAPSK
jgi:hypothetical protein